MTAVQGEPLSANEGQGWTVDDSEFGARLALVRQRMKWNIKEAATQCSLPPASWASWEAGAMPRQYAEICDKIAVRTGADYLWLLAGSAARAPRRQATLPNLVLAEWPSIQMPRSRDNRPVGHPVSGAGAGVGRTAYVSRTARRKRDR